MPRPRLTARLGSKATAMAAWCAADRGRILQPTFVRPPAPGAPRMISSIPTASASREVFDRLARPPQPSRVTSASPRVQLVFSLASACCQLAVKYSTLLVLQGERILPREKTGETQGDPHETQG